jgi:hypothetical protein
MTPMRANIVGPPEVATRINASIAACHSWASCSAFGRFVMKLPASSNGSLGRAALAVAPDSPTVEHVAGAVHLVDHSLEFLSPAPFLAEPNR